MDALSATKEPGVESELIDLNAVSMTALRKLDDTALRQALQHVMHHTARPQLVTIEGPGPLGSTD